jgi:hypothetical protein
MNTPEIYKHGEFEAYYLSQVIDYGTGNIVPVTLDAEQREAWAMNAMQSVERIALDQLAYSGCTDGRGRLELADGSPAPVRAKLAGADTMTMFDMAEAIANDFYTNPNAPVADRFEEVISFMLEAGLKPSTHGPSCGAAAGYIAVLQNRIAFAANPHHQSLKAAELGDVYDEAIDQLVVDNSKHRLESGLYDGWSEDLVRDAVLRVTGKKGIKELHAPHKGVHGHEESLRVDLDIAGYDINTNKLAMISGGQVFVVNSDRLKQVAELFARQQERCGRITLHAGRDFQDSAHATLGNNFATLKLRRAASALL